MSNWYFSLWVNDMDETRRFCNNKPGVFCYISSKYTVVLKRNPVTSVIKCAYHIHFGMKLGDQDGAWLPHGMQDIHRYLRCWTTVKKSCLEFGISCVWKEPTYHGIDSYFCTVDLTGIDRKK